VRVLPVSFNPPAEFGVFWWCSLAEMNGVPAGESVDVVVPLRRPIAPFTKLALFQQNAYGSWSLLPKMGTVTADGLSVAYVHPGGLVASGGEEGLQPAQVNLEEATDGTSNTIAFSESPSQPDNVVQTGVEDGTNNTVIIGEANSVPPPATDGTSNTVIIGEVDPIPPPATDGTSNTVIIGEVDPVLPPATDGNSNTIIIGEETSAPAFSPTTGAVDGNSNTIIIGEETSAPAFSPTTGAVDGNSNTIIIGEVTLTPPPALVTSTPEPEATLALITTSTTEIITREPEDRATSTPRPTQMIRIVTATPQLQTPVAALPTRTPAPTLDLPVVAFNVPAYMETGYSEESGEIRVVIFKQEAGFLQCQSGGLICALLNRTARP